MTDQEPARAGQTMTRATFNHDARLRAYRSRHGRRGSAYIMILMTAMMASTFGLAGMYVSRVQNRNTSLMGDWKDAETCAMSAIDLGLLIVMQNPEDWRTRMEANTRTPIDKQAIGRGTCTTVASDPVDGDLANNKTDPVVLTGIGRVGKAVFKWQVKLDANGELVPGSWRRIVD